jgi:hypothetical protein
MLRRNLAFFMSLSILSINTYAVDLEHSVSGDNEIENSLENAEIKGDSPFVLGTSSGGSVENSKAQGVDYIFDHGVKEVSDKISPRQKYEDSGYTLPGTFEKQENYIDIDKKHVAKDFRKISTGSMNISFIKNDFDYQSTNDVINRTVGMGYKHIKGGALYFRHDDYIVRRDLINAYWSLGAGVGYNSGKGIFIDGTRSDATFNLWEVPVDLGLGMEVPLYSWFKIAGTGGPSVLGLVQNRSDFKRGEDGKRKYQVSPGYFLNGQMKINLTGFNEETAYDLFTSSQITNLFLNLEARHQSYNKFQDDIKISGTSFGIGFTFEYL